jgi:transketolase
MRAELSRQLCLMAHSNSFILLSGDHGYSLFDDLRKIAPEKFVNVGIAEQNMVGVAAGLARVGFRPIVYGLAAFVPIRVLEQIKIDVAHDNLPIIFIGDGASLVYSTLGTSHQAAEDVAALRSIPNLTIFSPADRNELENCMAIAQKINGPSYMRIGKSDLGDIHTFQTNFEKGELLEVLKGGESNSLTFIACGSMVKIAIDIAKKEFIGTRVFSAPTIKPISKIGVLEISKCTSQIVVFEEHSIRGGLGSEIAEICSEFNPLKILRIGIDDVFTQKCGSYEYVLSEHKLDRVSLIKKIAQFTHDEKKKRL